MVLAGRLQALAYAHPCQQHPCIRPPNALGGTGAWRRQRNGDGVICPAINENISVTCPFMAEGGWVSLSAPWKLSRDRNPYRRW